MATPASDKCLDALRIRAAGTPLPLNEVEPVLRAFLDRARRYAELERMTLGSVPLSFPAHLLLGDLAEAGEPFAEGMVLAGRERERLALETGAYDRLIDDIENGGVKVIELAFPPDLDMLGAFVFDESFGPAILVDAARPLEARQYAVAHEYAHFLADNNPWTAHVCRNGGATDSPEELRAHAFAGALLVPGTELREFLEGAGVSRDGIDAPLVRRLEVCFQADIRAILGGLLALGWIGRDDIARLMRARPDELDDAVPRNEAPPLPTSRFVSLAVLARRRGRLTWDELAGLLGTDSVTARKVDSLFAEFEEGADGRRED